MAIPLAIPPGARVSGSTRMVTAAELRDFVGVNVHWKAVAPNPNSVPANVVADIAALGLRHARDTLTGSWWSTVFTYYRAGALAVRVHNSSLSVGEQPIFLTSHTPGYTGYFPSNFGNDFSFTVADFFDIFDGGRLHWRPQLSPRQTIPDGTTSNPNATVPDPWNDTDSEIPWEVVGLITGPNEPDATAPANLKPWTSAIHAELNTKTAPAHGGHPVVTEQGIRSGLTAAHIPVAGPSITNRGIAISAGDMSSDANVCHLGDDHPYFVGIEPSDEYIDDFLNTVNRSYNGTMASPPSLAKRIPQVLTEFTHTSAGVDQVGFNDSPKAHSGYWPAPEDVNAHHLLQMVVLCARRPEIRRIYWYELYDETSSPTSESRMGLLRQDRTLKPSGLALRNLMSLIPFSEGTNENPIAYSVSGFVAHGTDGSGLNKHLGMYSGNGDFGVTGAGQVYHQNQHRLRELLVKASDTEYYLILTDTAARWDREKGNWSGGAPSSLADVAGGRFTPSVQNLTVTFPGGVQSVDLANPTAGLVGTNSGAFFSWPNPNDGMAWEALTVTGGTSVPVQTQGDTIVLRVRLTAGDAVAGSLPVQAVRDIGLAPAYTAADPDGHSFATGSRVFLHIKNAGATSVTATIPVPYQPFEEFQVTDITSTVAAGQTKMLGPFPPQWFGTRVQVALSATAGVTLGAFELQRS